MRVFSPLVGLLLGVSLIVSCQAVEDEAGFKPDNPLFLDIEALIEESGANENLEFVGVSEGGKALGGSDSSRTDTQSTVESYKIYTFKSEYEYAEENMDDLSLISDRDSEYPYIFMMKTNNWLVG